MYVPVVFMVVGVTVCNLNVCVKVGIEAVTVSVTDIEKERMSVQFFTVCLCMLLLSSVMLQQLQVTTDYVH